MTLGANQPYFLPYLGYFQLIHAVDKFLVLDDFNYIKGGWINRNRILRDGKTVFLSVPVSHASPNREINKHYVCGSVESMLRSIREAYRKASLFEDVFPIITSVMEYSDKNLGAFVFNSIRTICDYLGIATSVILNSSRDDNTELRSEQRVIHLCKTMGADTYVNAIGGLSLYNRDNFAAEGIRLRFLKGELPPYRQLRTQDFVSALSILDIMMNIPRDEIRDMLDRFSLV